ncbi:asparagine synthase C-terminal domain-containing protein, partial [Bacillus vallismortis]|nr:asparagine synthase C-terminal domain-containing protein [Bacillus vallismortis]
FLSGGLVSSAFSAVAAGHFENEGNAPLHTYSIDYEENDKFFKASAFQPNDDGPWIEKMTEAFGTNHHKCDISQKNLVDHLEEAVLV